MEVDAISFPHHLLEMLIAISEAEFVSFDLELTGIPSHIPGRPRNSKRSTLEDRYLESKEGADRYQILQFGFTCVRFDYLANRYVLKPYNINISPLLDERLDIEREVSFQTGAITFLLNHGFNFDLPFTKGVQYLSRHEATLAKQIAYDRFDKKNVIEDLQLKETDVDSLDFLHRVRDAIKMWKASNSQSLDITTRTGMPELPAAPAITRFEKRLVHQLVRAEYPDLVSIGRTECIKIIHYNEEREAENTRRLKNRVKESIARQTGFRWIVEALAQGKIDGINPIYFAKNSSGMVIAADPDSISSRLKRAAMRLQNRQPILVGHNMFTDLVYLYRIFIGELPKTLSEFCNALHELFPRIVDTKYLATHDGGDLNASPTLQEIAEGLESQSLPDIVTHSSYTKYHDTQAFHEAGYDSLLTATIMLQLSAKIDAKEKTLCPQVSSDLTATEGESLDNCEDNQPSLSLIEDESLTSPDVDEQSKKKVKQNKNKTKKDADTNRTSRFASDNQFAHLGLEDNHINEYTKEYPINKMKREPMEMMPNFDDEFWVKFGNRLRIFGTQESVLEVAEWVKPERTL